MMKNTITEIDMVSDSVTDVTGVQQSQEAALDDTPDRAGNVTDDTKVDDQLKEPPVSADDRPCWHVYDDFTHLNNGQVMRPGTYWLDVEKDEGGNPIKTKDQWICSPIHIEAQTMDQYGNNFGRLLRLRNSNGKWREWAMPMELLRSGGEELRGTLLGMGVLIDPYFFKNLSVYLLQTVPPKQTIHCVLNTGWFDRDAYVLPDKVIGPGAEQVVFQSPDGAHEEFTQAGNLTDWKENIASFAVENPMLMLGLSCAFVGPLLKLTNSEGGGIHMVGESSSGKSSIARAAASVWGGLGFARSWNTTANGLEGAASLCNDGLLVLDEISQCDPSDVSEIAYAVTNGVGKQRANRYGAARRVTKWRCFALSNGERTISTVIQESGKRVKAGQMVRILDLHTMRKFGAWDYLYGFKNGAALSDHISSEGEKNYGHAGRAFLECLTYDDIDFCERLNQIKTLPEFSSEGAEGQEKRAAARFALIALAGEIASDYGITGWSSGLATQAAALGFEIWKSQRGKGNDEKRQVIESLSDFIEKHCDSRFSDKENTSDKTVHNRAGYWRDIDERRIYYLTSSGMREALDGFDFKSSLDILQVEGLLPQSVGERAKTYRVKGQPVKLYEISLEGAVGPPAKYPVN